MRVSSALFKNENELYELDVHMISYSKGKKSQDEEKSETFSRLKENNVEQPFVYRQSDIFKMSFLLNRLGLDWLPLSHKQSKRGRWAKYSYVCSIYSFSFDSHIKGGKQTSKQHPPNTIPNEVEKSSIK